MKINTMKFIVLTLVFCGGQLFAQDIEPFGGLSWTNGLWAAVSKIVKMEGIEKLGVDLNNVGSIDAKSVSSQKDLTEKLRKLVLDYLAQGGPTFGHESDTFSDKDNKKWKYDESATIMVTCSPVVIKEPTNHPGGTASREKLACIIASPVVRWARPGREVVSRPATGVLHEPV